MKRSEIKYCFTILICMLAILSGYGQDSKKVIVQTENCNKLIVGINNYISIVATQSTPITKEQVKAFLLPPSHYYHNTAPISQEVEQEYGKFKLRPDSLGMVEFHVEIDGKTEIAAKQNTSLAMAVEIRRMEECVRVYNKLHFLRIPPMVETIGYQIIRRDATWTTHQLDSSAKCHRHDLSGSLRFQPWAN